VEAVSGELGSVQRRFPAKPGKYREFVSVLRSAHRGEVESRNWIRRVKGKYAAEQRRFSNREANRSISEPFDPTREIVFGAG